MRNFIAIVLAFLATPVFAQDGPQAIVEQTANELIEALDGRYDELAQDKQQLYNLVDEILLPRFDLQFAGAYVLGKYRRTATNDQKRRFITAFYRTLIERYAEGLLDYKQTNVDFLPFKPSTKPTRAEVRTVVTLADGTKTPVDYALRQTDDGWKVYDVTIEGISYLRNNRKLITTEIEKKGLDDLIARLESGSVDLE